MKDQRNPRRRTMFEVFKGKVTADGKFVKERAVGIAFLREGKLEYKVKVFPQLSNRFYVVPDEKTSGRYRVLVKDEIQLKFGKSKIYWSEVGEGFVLPHLGLMEIIVDLWAEPLYMSIFPKEFESSAKPFARLGELKLVA